MGEPLVLSIDCGTQSVRVLLVDQKGNLPAFRQVSFTPYFSLKPGYAEQRADLYFEKICEACLYLKEQEGEMFSRVRGVTLTTMRDTAVCLDQDLKPLRPAILWLDDRDADVKKKMPLWKRAAFFAAGKLATVNSIVKKTKSNWIRENEPEIWEKTHKYVMLSCYLTYRLTGRLADSTASQIGHIAFDYKKKRWMRPSAVRYHIFNVEPDKQAELLEPGNIAGFVTAGAAEASGIPAGTPFILSGSDKGCETLGSGCSDEETAAVSFGTTCTVQLWTKRYVEPQRYMPAYPAVMSGVYNPEVEIYRGYWMVSWFKKEFAKEETARAEALGVPVEDVLNEYLSLIPPGSDGLFLQPYWGGGLANPDAKGAIIGFFDVHTRGHIYRAIIEGLNYALLDGLKTMERRSGLQVKRLTVSGGGAVSDQICQITADMFGLPVFRAQTNETAGLGAAAVAFHGLGMYENVEQAAKAMVRPGSVFLPDADNQALYGRLYREVYQKIYQKLAPLYRSIPRE